MNRRSPFFPIWAGQVVSIFGSNLSGFALGVWLYQQTSSSSNFALVAICTALPVLLLSPLAGVWVDRYPRRWMMAAADSGAAVCTLIAAGLFLSGQIQPWQIFLLTALNSACGALQVPAYSALVPGLVPAPQLARANGMIQFGQGLAEILAPMLAGALVGWVGVPGVLWIDLGTFLVGISTLLLVPVKERPADRVSQERFSWHSLINELKTGWDALRFQPGLVSLLRFQMLFGFLWSLFGVLVTPMILGFSDPQGLGLALTLAGGGMLAGSLLLSAWGGPHRRVRGILGFELASAAAFVGMGLRPELWLVAGSALLAHFTLAFVSSLAQSIWQSQIGSDVLGRVLALRQALVKAATLLAYLVAGGLADRVLEPALRPGGWLAPYLRDSLGVGPGRGIAALFLVIGLVKAFAVLRIYLLPAVRELDQSSQKQHTNDSFHADSADPQPHPHLHS
jgi:MFS family permease